MMTKNNLMRVLYIVTNYGGDGTHCAYGEMLMLFYLFYNNKEKASELVKMVPSRHIRTRRRHLESLSNKGFVILTKEGEQHNARITAEITEKGTLWCLRWLNRADALAARMAKGGNAS